MSVGTQHRAWFTAARERACLSQDQLAHMVGTAPRTINNWERGRTMPAVPKRRPLAEALGFTTDELNRHLGVASAPEPAALNGTGATPFAQLAEWMSWYVRAEQSAVAIWTFEVTALPPLTQTAGYARAVELSGHRPVTAEEVDHLVETRLDRAAVLDTGAEYAAIIPAPLLGAAKGDYRIMAEQLAHLLNLADRSNITLWVIDYQHVSVAPGPFTLLATFGSAADTVAEFTFNEPFYSHGTATVADRVAAFEHLRSLALDPEASRRALEKAADRFARAASRLTTTKGPTYDHMAEVELQRDEQRLRRTHHLTHCRRVGPRLQAP